MKWFNIPLGKTPTACEYQLMQMERERLQAQSQSLRVLAWKEQESNFKRRLNEKIQQQAIALLWV